MVEEALQQDGYEVQRAADGAEAVQLAGRQQFDLILLDAEMSDMDGVSACRSLRADKRLEAVPIVLLTSRSGEEELLGESAEGVTDYMTKPIAVSLFRARVHSWLTRAAEDG